MTALVEQLVQRLSLNAPVPAADGQRRAAVAIVLHDASSGPRVLLMKRADREGDPWSGHISLPGGGYQADDPDLLTTAIRETREELGVDLSAVQLLGNLKALAPRSAGPTLIEVTPFVFLTDTELAPICGPEALAAFWLPLELATSGALDGTYTYPQTEMRFPSWTYEGYVIWGLTKRILDDVVAAGC